MIEEKYWFIYFGPEKPRIRVKAGRKVVDAVWWYGHLYMDDGKGSFSIRLT